MALGGFLTFGLASAARALSTSSVQLVAVRAAMIMASAVARRSERAWVLPTEEH
ncbi:hypothetical protein [Streptomyces lanatus]|uniref:Secreted protein n=1 Tax=Streptomyces lanatus TaxID=66900 RepID=A0ABV1XUB6_9ACTN|nr:hypothetical protein [Streptomyces lanatus]